MNDQELADIRARCEAADAGPWDWGANPAAKPGAANEVVVRPAGEFPHGLWIADVGRTCDRAVDNGRFIARARSDVPRLLAEVERLQRGIAALHANQDADLCGASDFLDGKPRDANPYPEEPQNEGLPDDVGDARHAAWDCGWIDEFNAFEVKRLREALSALEIDGERTRKALVIIRNWPFDIMGDCVADARRIAAEGLGDKP